jgi:predicted DNA-binding protein with PD1-like motif
MTVTTTNARHVLFRLAEPARLPESLLGTLRDEVVLAGWMRASGILHDVQLRVLGGTTVRALTGSVQVVALEGSIGLSQGDVTCGLRAVLARETDTGIETIAGEIVEAQIDALEVMVTAFDDVTATRQAGALGTWLLDASAQRARPAAAPAAEPVRPAPPPPVVAPAPAPAPPPPPAPVVAVAPSEPEPAKPAVPKPSPTFSAPAVMPARPVRPKVEEEEQVYPDAGDIVEHFAFGRCEVVKSDGDRLHLRLGKDGRVKEIALEMLRVTPLEPEPGGAGRHFKLDRKL